MALVARRRMSETWAQAIAREAGERAPSVLADFDARVARGEDEVDAAYRALEAHDALATVRLPGDPSDTPDEAEEAQIEPDLLPRDRPAPDA